MAQQVRFVVSAGTVPEGFCPKTWQDALNTIVSLIAVSPNQQYATFVTGSQAPTSNQGPWLKDGLEWFVWSDSVGGYVPITKQGFTFQQYFSASGAFIVPPFIYKLRISAWGAGGGGGDAIGVNNGGGAGGGFALKLHDVSPNENIVIVVGTGGANSTPNGVAGGNTTVADDSGVFITCVGGSGSLNSGNDQAVGGGASGGDIVLVGGSGAAAFGAAGAGGDAAGWGGKGGAIGLQLAQRVGTAPGGGGAGGINGVVDPTGGSGAAGGVLIEW